MNQTNANHQKGATMVRAAAVLTCLGVLLSTTIGEADNQVRWTVHVDEAGIGLPPALFKDHVLPTLGTRWHCFADKVLRQDASGNTFSTLTVHCTDGETTASSSASCQIGGHETARLAIDLLEKTSGVKNTIRAECEG
jgi:hypothetical protein